MSKRYKQTELLILIFLWSVSLTTYSVAILSNYYLLTSDYLGLGGLLIASIMCSVRPDKSLQIVLVLLILGLFNLLSFAYFINMVVSFGFSFFVTPGIQLISFVLLGILTVKRHEELSSIMNKYFGQTPEEKQKKRHDTKDQFKTKFCLLSDVEIDNKLQQNLIPEAIEALQEIKKERLLENP